MSEKLTLREIYENTGQKSTYTIWKGTDAIHQYDSAEYVAWLESQLTWRSAEEPPEETEVVIIRAKWDKNNPYLATYDASSMEWVDSENFSLESDYWLPVPKLGEN